MRDGTKYAGGRRIYTFVDALTGENTHVDSEELRLWVAAHRRELEVVMTPVTAEIADRHLADRAVQLDHVFEVMLMESLDPIIYGLTGTFTEGRPDVLLIDGHHRYVGMALEREPMIPSVLLQPDQWHPFIIEGLPDMTAEQLRAIEASPGGRRR